MKAGTRAHPAVLLVVSHALHKTEQQIGILIALSPSKESHRSTEKGNTEEGEAGYLCLCSWNQWKENKCRRVLLAAEQ